MDVVLIDLEDSDCEQIPDNFVCEACTFVNNGAGPCKMVRKTQRV